MNWQAVGALSELIGAMGVIVTLIFLIVQIQMNTRAIRAASYQASVAPISALSFELGANKDAAELVARGSQSPDDLSEVEWVRFSALCVALWRNFDNIFYQYESGMIEGDVWQGWKQAILAQYFLPGIQRWYLQNKSRYRPTFQKLLDEAKRSDLETSQGVGGSAPRAVS